MKNNKEQKYYYFSGKKYYFDLEKIKEICLTSSNSAGNKEYEISQAYEADDDGNLKISSKVEHETKIIGNQQNDVIIYDIVKLMIVSLLENGQEEKNFSLDMGTCLTLNTLIHWGILKEIE